MQRDVRTLRQDVHSIGIIICRNHGATHSKNKSKSHNAAGNVWVAFGIGVKSNNGVRRARHGEGRRVHGSE